MYCNRKHSREIVMPYPHATKMCLIATNMLHNHRNYPGFHIKYQNDIIIDYSKYIKDICIFSLYYANDNVILHKIQGNFCDLSLQCVYGIGLARCPSRVSVMTV